MDSKKAAAAFGSLSQETRLNVFRLLVKAGSDGLPAGKIGEALGIPHNTLSFHLSHMSSAGLTASRREGRSIIYAADFSFVRDLIAFMVENCCSGDFVSIKKDKADGSAIVKIMDCCMPKKGKKI